MKNGKRPTKAQKIIMIAAQLDPDDWLVVKNLSGEMHIVHRQTEQKKIIPA
ncbi:DUF6906 family protein [Gordoniibacillus kamchatkensis]|uniref:DUF6906 family protein n=1 Tax=Gordoniibacillus kamchatkensis TaxID=1590651 RepID=UPI000A853AB0|nr:hypothetical protein [Paenibacillus sp. VKM B-2647]